MSISMLIVALAGVLGLIAAGVAYFLIRGHDRRPRFGPYRLIRPIGGGGMGELWRAQDTRTGEVRAVKIARSSPTGTFRSHDSLRDEVSVLLRLTSPHTVRAHDTGMVRGRPWFAMDLIDGLDLQQLVEAQGTLETQQVLDILTQVCDSLAELHEAGFVHRDIKPSNVMVDGAGRVTVVDFGLAQRFEVRADAAPARVSGSPPFLAPELVTGGIVDGAVDVYAIGCVAYWLLTGELVFSGDSALEVIRLHVFSSPVPPSLRTSRWIPHRVEDVIMACLEKDPQRRPRDAQALRRRLCEACEAPSPSLAA